MGFLRDVPEQSSALPKTLAGFLNSLLQDLAFCGLWITEVHHLIQQLIDDDEVVSDTLFLQLLEVLCKHLDDLVKEEKDFGGIGVPFRESEEVEVIMPDVQVLLNASAPFPTGQANQTRNAYIDTLVRKTWRHGGALFFGFTQEDGELLDRGHGDVTAVVSGKKGLAEVSRSIAERVLPPRVVSIPCPSSPERRSQTPWRRMGEIGGELNVVHFERAASADAGFV